ncbi:MAG TPA: permease-like cell division protein FtsX, partial [Candidatus Deferrimicrobiaceae bacterium]
MNFFSLLWIDWRLAWKPLAREWANRFVMFFVLALLLLSMLASGGVNRFLSEQWVVNAVLRLNVSPAEGKGIAVKAEKLPAVRSVVYKDPETAWKEFVADYPGLESLRLDGGNPVPGYLLIRLAPDRLTAGDIAAVENALKPLPQVDKVFTGARTLPRLLKVRGWVNLALWGLYALLAFVLVFAWAMQEAARARALRGDFGFLAGRGVSPAAIMTARAAGSAIVGALVVLPAAGLSALAIAAALRRYPGLDGVVGPIDSLARAGTFPFVVLFLVSVPCLTFVASLY